jgi:hypothetical protein
MFTGLWYILFFFLLLFACGNHFGSSAACRRESCLKAAFAEPAEASQAASFIAGNQDALVRLKDYSERMVREKARGNQAYISKILYFLMLLSLVFVTSWLVIMLYVLLIKAYRIRRDKRRAIIEVRYLRIIASCLSRKNVSAYPHFPRLRSTFNQKVLINQLYRLSASMIGRQRERLNIFYENRHIKKLMNRALCLICKDVKTRYMKYFSIRRLSYEQLERVQKHLNSRNHQLRLFSQLAVLNYEPQMLGDILAGYKHPLTTWDQMHIFDLMLRRSSHPVDYYDFIDHENPTVVIFALRMIRYFFLKDEREHKIIPLLSHSSEQIRYEALKTASDLKVEEVDKLLLAYISEINEKYKELIIEFLIRNGLVSSGELMDFFHQEKDRVAKLYILEAIQNRYPTGEDLIRKLEQMTSDPDVRAMCLHVMEKSL